MPNYLGGAVNDLMSSGLGGDLKNKLLEEEEKRKKLLEQSAGKAGSFGPATQMLFGIGNPASSAF